MTPTLPINGSMRIAATKISVVILLATLSSACTLRYARSSFTDPALDEAQGLAIEGGVYFWEGALAGQRADIGLTGIYQKFDFYTDAAASHVEGRMRWFPLQEGLVDPYVGAGLGIYRLNRTETVATCRNRGICLDNQFDQRGQATGLTPHVVLGAELRPGNRQAGLVLAVTREFGSFDPEWDLTAWRISAGLVLRPK